MTKLGVGLLVPHVKLKLSLAHGRARVGLICSFDLSELAGSSHGSKVHSFKNITIQLARFGAVKGHAKGKEGVCKALHTEANGAMAQVAALCLGHGVEAVVNHLVQVFGGDLGDTNKLVKIIGLVFCTCEKTKVDRCQVANGYFIGCSVLNDLSAQVGRTDGAQVLLVRLGVARILEEHVRRSGFDLRGENGVPELLSTNCFATTTILLVLLIQLVKLLTVDVSETRCLVGAEQCPCAIGLDSAHEQIIYPHAVKQVASTGLLLSVVLLELEKGLDIGVPWL
mmetsp:Transcript_7938/g.14064  ORF Transcript_7938/g.14064 Transcript_7938/m.14064 type:complete len:282 (+) Transcript_7938:864-1709(+)